MDVKPNSFRSIYFINEGERLIPYNTKMSGLNLDTFSFSDRYSALGY